MSITTEDFKYFADIGSTFHETVNDDDSITLQFHMDSGLVSVNFKKDPSEPISFIDDGDEKKFLNLKSLLSSPKFGNLSQWARNQKLLLGSVLPDNPINTLGEFTPDISASKKEQAGIVEFDGMLTNLENKHSLHTTIIDGPAGIGKTMLIQRLAAARARDYHKNHSKLVLHVESRGRVLQNITDLISASLHTIRATVTCEQLLVLVKHGMVMLAVDGFDELADPNGYQMAWSQLDDLLGQIDGQGQVILSGRETFVSPGRMKASLPFLGSSKALLSQYTMNEVALSEGRKWLVSKGWDQDEANSEQVSEMLSPGSYGARPFYLYALSDPEIFERIRNDDAVDLLSILVDSLIEREISKFGDDIIQQMGEENIRNYLFDVNEEIARDMADSQGEVLPGQTVSYISQMCIPDATDVKLSSILVQRAQTLPFFTNSENRNSLRFIHRQYFVFFLGRSTIKSVASGETPKYLRSNILGAEFLEAFDKVTRIFSLNVIKQFQNSCMESLKFPNVMDRSAGNIASVLITSICNFPLDEIYELSGVSIDEMFVSGELSNLSFHNVVISSLFALNSDISGVSFDSACHIYSLHVDTETTLPTSFPAPAWIEAPDRTINEPSEIENHINSLSGRKNRYQYRVKLPADPDLIKRVLMYRSFWLKLDSGNDEPVVQRIISDKNWDSFYQWMKDNELVRIEDRSFAGKSGTFVHFRKYQIAAKLMTEMKKGETVAIDPNQ